jgi:hypothetical protein
MRYQVLFFERHVRETHLLGRVVKDRVVAESPPPGDILGDKSFRHAFHGIRLLVDPGHGDNAPETGRALVMWHTLKFPDQFAVVVLVGDVFAGVTRGVHSRRAVESVNFQAAVIGQGGQVAELGNRFGFQQGVGLKGVAGLFDIGEIQKVIVGEDSDREVLK